MELTNQDIKTICNIILIIGFLLILVSFLVVVLEINSAKKSCKKIESEYNFNYKTFQHLCNNELYLQYSDGWDYKRITIEEINLSNLLLDK